MEKVTCEHGVSTHCDTCQMGAFHAQQSAPRTPRTDGIICGRGNNTVEEMQYGCRCSVGRCHHNEIRTMER